MLRYLFIALFVVLFVNGQAQLADRWIFSASDFGLNTPKSLFWEHKSGQLLLVADDSSGIPQVYRIDLLNSKIEQLTHDTVFKTSVSAIHATNELIITGLIGQKLELLKLKPGDENTIPLIHRKLQKKEAHTNAAGNMVAFAGKEENDRMWNLYTYDYTYNNLNKLSSDEFQCSYPMWSPGAEYISYQSKAQQETFMRIKVIHWYGKQHFEIFDNEHHVLYPSWSPNNQWLVYVKENHEGSKLMICRKNGTDKSVIYQSTNKISYPVWSPTGDSIAILIQDAGNRARLCLLVQE